MKIVILSRNKELYSTSRLLQTCEQRGHEVKIIDPLRCYMNIEQAAPTIHYRGEELRGYQAVIPRIGASITFYGMAVLRQFEMRGCFTLNDSVAFSRARDKLRALQILARKGLGLPKTSFAHSTQKVDDLIDLAGGVPLVIKLLEGTQGKGVVLAETRKAAESVIEAFRAMNATFLVQEFIKEAGGMDIRCFVVGDKVVAAMSRQAQDGEFRSNLHRGGSASAIKITKEERATAIQAAKALGLNVAGVDILRSNRGPMIMEVNASPGLQGVEQATDTNVAAKIIEFIEKNVKLNRTRHRGFG